MKPGEIVLVKFPFSDLETSKKRPALVMSRSDLTEKVGVVTIAMITSKMEGLRFPGDCKIGDWESAGLLHPSLVRLAKMATIDADLVDKSLGQLGAADIKGIKLAFQKQFKVWL